MGERVDLQRLKSGGMGGRMACLSAASAALIALVSLMPVLLWATDAQGAEVSPTSDGAAEYQRYAESMDETARFVRDFRSTLDRTTFDLEALLDSLDYDADNIIEFVRSSISFEQYPGVLRGPKGTLFSRAGNSIDQAILLAKMLRDSGYDARIAGVELDADAAALVLKAMKQPVDPAPPFGDADEILRVFAAHDFIEPPFSEQQKRAYAEYVRTAPRAESSSIGRLARDTAGFVQTTLADAGVRIESGAEDVQLLEEARHYYWVQYKAAASDPWSDVHPVFIDEESFPAPKASTFISDEVPGEMQHRFRFQVFIERKVGDRLEVLPLTAAWERPVANLVGVPLTFSNLSDAMMSASSLGQDSSVLLDSSKFLAPVFGETLAQGASYFDLRGTLVDPMVAQGPGADLFATVGAAFASAVGEIGDRSSVPTLTAQWLEFTFISPNGQERVYRRMTFDRIGAAARRNGEVPADLKPTVMADVRPLIALHTFMVGVGVVPRGYVLDSGLARFEAMRGGVDELMSGQFRSSGSTNDVPEIPVSWANYLAQLSIFDIADTIGTERRSYRAGPGLAIHRIGPDPDGKNVETMDIVSNPRRAVDISRATPSIAPATAMEAGIWETAVEGILLSGTDSFDTWQAFELAERLGAKPVILLPGDSGSGARLPADVRAAIDVDLANDYAVIVPGTVDSVATAGWWRVNLQTGETLGQLHDGRGSVAEYLKAAGIIYSGTLLVMSVGNCADGASSQSSMGCCTLGNTLVTLFTFAVGNLARAPALLALGTGIGVDAAAYNLPVGEYCESRYGWGSGYR